MGVWKCCLPWCGPAEGKAAPPSSPPIPPTTDLQPRARQPSPHLQDIAEESDPEDAGVEATNSFNESSSISTTLNTAASTRVSYKKRRGNVQSPSPTLSIKASRKSQRTRSITSTTSSDTSTTAAAAAASLAAAVPTKMQAEQGSIGDLQRYHNRYLRNRRHTLANVR